MKAPFFILLSSALLIAGVTPSWSENAPSPAVSANGPTGAVDHVGYLRTVKRHMAEWRTKLDDLGARASGATTGAGKDAKMELSSAWARVELAAGRLDSASTTGWQDAKAAYERAGEDFALAWAKFKPAKI
jgi:hypothetical protein